MLLSRSDIEQAIKYPFEAKDWFVRLCLQGALLGFLSLFLVGIPLAIGFQVTLVRRGIDGSKELPDFNEWGQYWKRGWKLLGVAFVHVLPVLAVWISIPILWVITAALIAVDERFAVLVFPLMFVGGILYFFGFIYNMFVGVLSFAYFPVIAMDAPTKLAFAYKRYMIPYLKSNFMDIFIVFVIGYIAGMFASVGIAALFIGYFFTFPIAIAISSYLTGVLYRKSAIKIPA